MADANRTLDLGEAFREQSMYGGQGMRQCVVPCQGRTCGNFVKLKFAVELVKKSVDRVVRVQMQNNALLKGTSAVR